LVASLGLATAGMANALRANTVGGPSAQLSSTLSTKFIRRRMIANDLGVPFLEIAILQVAHRHPSEIGVTRKRSGRAGSQQGMTLVKLILAFTILANLNHPWRDTESSGIMSGWSERCASSIKPSRHQASPWRRDRSVVNDFTRARGPSSRARKGLSAEPLRNRPTFSFFGASFINCLYT